MGVVLKNCASDLRAVLTGTTVNVDSGTLMLTSDTNLFLFDPEMQAQKVEGVYLINMSGEMPQAYMNGSSDRAYVQAKVRVSVIGGTGAPGFLRGEQIARGVLATLQQCDPSDGSDGTKWLQVLSKQALPEYKGITSDKLPYWEFEMQCEFTTS